MRFSTLLMTTALTMSLGVIAPAQAGSTLFFSNNQRYRSIADSPFANAGGNLTVENFEGSGGFNADGVRINRGRVQAGDKADSVDRAKRGGQAYSSGSGNRSLTFRFDRNSQGQRPTAAGVVWTDGRRNAVVTFKAWDSNGELIAKMRVKMGDLSRNGTTRDDRFFGVMSDEGISKMQLTVNKGSFEVDHLQFGYGLSVVPIPPALGMGMAGLAGVAAWKGVRRRRRDLA